MAASDSIASVLQKIVDTESQIAIIDVTGVPTAFSSTR